MPVVCAEAQTGVLHAVHHNVYQWSWVIKGYGQSTLCDSAPCAMLLPQCLHQEADTMQPSSVVHEPSWV